MKSNPFEKSKKDKEIPRKGKEGSKKEEMFDRMQKGKMPPRKMPMFKGGGAVGKKKGC